MKWEKKVFLGEEEAHTDTQKAPKKKPGEEEEENRQQGAASFVRSVLTLTHLYFYTYSVAYYTRCYF